ncbi:M23 family metallopeptidase [uncultured Ruminococcus sp.]|uniref:M23 family metallopeptidase n=1 Tax=uncultured Ruminococcus sp. TaxID=165186 RepID=UPI00292F36BA|nr:M23 family metallopeptidase [uncultured Ruminococcus sp.]
MNNIKKNKAKKPTERVSFYIALSICMMAVGLAVWSAYTSFGDMPEEDDESYFGSLSSPTAAVAQEMTGVTVSAETEAYEETEPEPETEQPTEKHSVIVSETNPETKDVAHIGGLDPLQAVLRVKESLIWPVKSQNVIKPYSEESVYSNTMKDYRAHTGCDFSAEEGESVYAMCAGTVKNISSSELYGIIVEVDCGDFTVYYCGLNSDLSVEKDSTIEAGDTIGTVGMIPCENDSTHVHVEIRVGDRLIDPLSVIDSER